MNHPRPFEVFESVEGYVKGSPYVLPHVSGERSYGLVSGWYFWAGEPDEAGPEGPFNSARAARREATQWIDATTETLLSN